MMNMVGARKKLRFAHHFSLFFFLLVSFLFVWWVGISLSIENEECLECHGGQDILRMSEKERVEMVVPTPGKEEVKKGRLTLYVDYSKFQSSVHQGLQCIDCHAEIQEIPHLQRMGMVKCARCHKEMVRQYDESKHAKVSKRFCFECHNPHTTISYKRLSQKERMGICLKCHKEEEAHAWLPQRELHFRYLECTACHAPKSEKGLFFHLTAQGEGRKRIPLSYQKLEGLAHGYNGDLAKAIDRNGNDLVEFYEINRFIAKLKEGGVQSPRIEEEVLVLRPHHNYTDEVKHIKDCTMCHFSGAPFYSQVMLRVPEQRGGLRTIKMDKAIIGKIPSIPSKDYYFTTVHGKSGVECIDCHADMTILREGEEFRVKEMGTPVCEKCHEAVMDEYRDSLHYKVSEEICFGCHDPHSSVPFKNLDVEQRKAICTQCHDQERGHDWLPQKETHFGYLECAMCHAPQAEKGIVFYLQRVDRKGAVKRLEYGEITTLLRMGNPDLVKLLDGDGNGFLENKEVLSFLRSMQQRSKGEKIEFGVRVLVMKPSHNYTDKGTKAKDCSLCHSSRAEFYSKLIMEIPEPGSGIRTLPLDKSILVGIHAIPVTSDFYLLGEGRISKRDIVDLIYVVRKIGYKWLDVIGILFLLAGLSFVGLHGLLGIVTRGMRKRRRQKT